MKRSTFKFSAVLCLLACFAFGTLDASAQKKKKKEKKPIEWVMPELTGNKDFDEYLLYCDTLVNKMKEFETAVPYYSVRKIRIQETGDSCYAVVDSAGVIRNSNVALTQYLAAATHGLELTAAFTRISTLTLSATTALPSLGLNALSYGKYIKTGGQLAIQCPAKIAEMLKKFKEQRTAIRAYKKGFDEKTGKIKDPTINPDTLEDLNLGDAVAIDKSLEEATAEFAQSDLEGQDVPEPDEI